MKLKNNISIILSFVVSGILIGCGGGSSSSGKNNSNIAVIKGQVIDGPISEIKVCIDANFNKTCDNGEPEDITNSNGEFSITYNKSKISPVAPLVAEPIINKSIDTYTNKYFFKTLKAYRTGNETYIYITDLSNIVANQVYNIKNQPGEFLTSLAVFNLNKIYANHIFGKNELLNEYNPIKNKNNLVFTTFLEQLEANGTIDSNKLLSNKLSDLVSKQTLENYNNLKNQIENSQIKNIKDLEITLKLNDKNLLNKVLNNGKLTKKDIVAGILKNINNKLNLNINQTLIENIAQKVEENNESINELNNIKIPIFTKNGIFSLGEVFDEYKYNNNKININGKIPFNNYLTNNKTYYISFNDGLPLNITNSKSVIINGKNIDISASNTYIKNNSEDINKYFILKNGEVVIENKEGNVSVIDKNGNILNLKSYKVKDNEITLENDANISMTYKLSANSFNKDLIAEGIKYKKYYLLNGKILIKNNINNTYILYDPSSNNTSFVSEVKFNNNDGTIVIDGNSYKIQNNIYNYNTSAIYATNDGSIFIVKNNKIIWVGANGNTKTIPVANFTIEEGKITIKNNNGEKESFIIDNTKTNNITSLNPISFNNFIKLKNGNLLIENNKGKYLITDKGIIKLSSYKYNENNNSITYNIKSKGLTDTILGQTKQINNINNNDKISGFYLTDNNNIIVSTINGQAYLLDTDSNKTKIDTFTTNNDIITYTIDGDTMTENINKISQSIENLINKNGNVKKFYILSDNILIQFDNGKNFIINKKTGMVYQTDNINENLPNLTYDITSNNVQTIEIVGNLNDLIENKQNVLNTIKLENGNIIIITKNNKILLFNPSDNTYTEISDLILNRNEVKYKNKETGEEIKENVIDNCNKIIENNTDNIQKILLADGSILYKINSGNTNNNNTGNKYILVNNNGIVKTYNENDVMINNENKTITYKYLDNEKNEHTITGTWKINTNGELVVLDPKTNNTLLNISLSGNNGKLEIKIENKETDKTKIGDATLADTLQSTITDETQIKHFVKDKIIPFDISKLLGKSYTRQSTGNTIDFNKNNVATEVIKNVGVVPYYYKIKNNVLILTNMYNPTEVIYYVPIGLIDNKHYKFNIIKTENGKVVRNYEDILIKVLDDKYAPYINAFIQSAQFTPQAVNYNNKTIYFADGSYYYLGNNNTVFSNTFNNIGLWVYENNVLYLSNMINKKFELGQKSANGPIHIMQFLDLVNSIWTERKIFIVNGKPDQKITNTKEAKNYITDNYVSPDLDNSNVTITFNSAFPNKLDITKIITYTYYDELTGQSGDTEIYIYGKNGLITHGLLKNYYNNGVIHFNGYYIMFTKLNWDKVEANVIKIDQNKKVVNVYKAYGNVYYNDY